LSKQVLIVLKGILVSNIGVVIDICAFVLGKLSYQNMDWIILCTSDWQVVL